MDTRKDRQAGSRKLFWKVATIENAVLYAATDEKWVFCTDLLILCEATEGADFVEYMVTRLEDKFDKLLGYSTWKEYKSVYTRVRDQTK